MSRDWDGAKQRVRFPCGHQSSTSENLLRRLDVTSRTSLVMRAVIIAIPKLERALLRKLIQA